MKKLLILTMLMVASANASDTPACVRHFDHTIHLAPGKTGDEACVQYFEVTGNYLKRFFEDQKKIARLQRRVKFLEKQRGSK